MNENDKKLLKKCKITTEQIDSDLDEIYNKIITKLKSTDEYCKEDIALIGVINQIRKDRVTEKETKKENRKEDTVIDDEEPRILLQETRE
jgi:hypothetical protein